MSKKSQDITSLSEAEFIYELTCDGSRVNNNPLQWTHEWLKERGASVKGLKGLGDWSGADVLRERKSDIIGCINAVIAAKRSVGGQKSSNNMTPEQRRERARKAAAASAAVRSAKSVAKAGN